MNSMLGVSSWAEIVTLVSWAGGENGWLAKLLTVLSSVLWVVLAIVGAAGAIYAVYVGVKMARADSAEAREENKKRLINIIVSIVVVIVLIIVFNVFVPMIIGAFTNDEGKWQDPTAQSLSKPETAVNTIRCLIGR